MNHDDQRSLDKKAEPLRADEARQASDIIGGYIYQVWTSIHAWLQLEPDEVLFLEVAEDFDVTSATSAEAVQVKRVSARATLRTENVIDAISNYWKLRQSNPERHVRFRYLTTADAGVEQGAPFGPGISGLDVWNQCGTNPDYTQQIKDFLLQESNLPSNLLDYLRTADKKDILHCLIVPIRWDTGARDTSQIINAIERILVYHGNKRGVDTVSSKRVLYRLLKEALDRITSRGDRSLDLQRFLELFDEDTRVSISVTALPSMLKVSNDLLALGAPSGEHIVFSLASRIQSCIPPLPPRVMRRNNFVTQARTRLHQKGLLALTGSAGMGKTTIAKLLAQADGDSWLWLSFSSIQSDAARVLVWQLGAFLDANKRINRVILDDLDFSPAACRLYEDNLAGVVFSLRSRDGFVVLTSQRQPPNRFMRMLGLAPEDCLGISRVNEAEILELLRMSGFAKPDDVARKLAKVISFQTQGHPQLVHARTQSLENKNWPDVAIEDILSTPEDIRCERQDTRQILVETLRDPEKTLLDWLGLVGLFRRDQALAIGGAAGLAAPGDVFDRLVGPWIEQLSEPYYRLSPLLDRGVTPLWDLSRVKQAQSTIADAMLSCGSLSTTDAETIFMQALSGRNQRVLLMSAYGITFSDEPIRKEISKNMSWFLHFGMDPPCPIFTDNPVINMALRMLQFRIAVDVDADRAVGILDVWDQEVAVSEPRELHLLQRHMLAMHAVLYYQVPLPPKRVLKYMVEMEQSADKLPSIKKLTEKIKIPDNLNLGNQGFFDPAAVLFSFIPVRCSGIDFVQELMEGIREIPVPLRNRMLSSYRDDVSLSTKLIDRAWLVESRKEKPDWRKCITVFEEVVLAAQECGIPPLAHAAARGMAIVYDEYLNNAKAAMTIIERVEKHFGQSDVVDDERATIHFHAERFSEALEIWEKVISRYAVPKRFDYEISVWTCRKAAIAAARIDNWLRAAKLFDLGNIRAEQTDSPWARVGLLADAGFAYWRSGKHLNCVERLRNALMNFTILPDPKTNFSSFAVQKLVGSVLVWLKNHLVGGNENDCAEPYVGMCSNPEPSERLRELPPTMEEYCWVLLAEIERDLSLDLGIFKFALDHYGKSDHVVVQVFLCELKITYAVRQNVPANVLETAVFLARMMHASRAADPSGKRIFQCVSEYKLSDRLQPEEIAFVHMTLVQALLCTMVGNSSGTTLQAWVARAKAEPLLADLALWINDIANVVRMNGSEANSTMRNERLDWSQRTVAAMVVATSDDSGPEDLFQAHIFLVNIARQRPLKMEYASRLCTLVEQGWRRAINFKALLRAPRINVPAIFEACDLTDNSLKKVASILLAASKMTSMRVPDTLLADLEKMKQGT